MKKSLKHFYRCAICDSDWSCRELAKDCFNLCAKFEAVEKYRNIKEVDLIS